MHVCVVGGVWALPNHTKQCFNTNRVVRELNSVLMLSAQRHCQIPQVKGTVLQDSPPDASHKPQVVVTCASDLLAKD